MSEHPKFKIVKIGNLTILDPIECYPLLCKDCGNCQCPHFLDAHPELIKEEEENPTEAWEE